MRQRDYHLGGQQLPLIAPESAWVVPAEPPDLRGRARVAVDLETRDDGLAAGRGPGWALGAGRVAGVSAAWDGGQVYLPVNHPDTSCLSREVVGAWLGELFRSGTRIVFHNASYDVGWARAEWGLKPPEKVEDTSVAAVLADEMLFSYKLDSVCAWRGVPGKDETALAEAAAAYGYAGDKVKQNLWRLPARYVGPYAEQDARATLDLAVSLDAELDAQELRGAYQLEMDLVPMVHEMRWRGVRVDVAAAERAAAELERRRDEVFAELSRKLGDRVTMVEIGSTRWLERAHDKEDIVYPRTAKTGQGSFTSGPTGWMDSHPHWLPRAIVRADRLNNAAQKFLRGFIVGYAHRGRVHPSINQCKNEEGGTRTTRFSYADPALQQIPARDEEIAPLVRACFLPEEGEAWCRPDFSQQEMRLIVHFSELLGLPRAQEAGDRYRSDPKTDYHEMVAEMTGLPRKLAKSVNFAKAYGAGLAKFMVMTKLPEDEARDVISQYDRRVPFVRELSAQADRLAKKRGYVRLLDGARVHFDHWCPQQRQADGWTRSYRREKAEREWPGEQLMRADTRKAGNALVQGSAARQTKIAMRDMWRAGVVPLVQLHDEVDCSVKSEREGQEIAQMMRDAVVLSLPVEVDVAYGPSWGTASSAWSDLGRAA